MVIFDPDVAALVVQLEGEGEDVVVGRAVPDDERAVRLVSQQPFRRKPRYWAPIPPVL